MAETNPLRRRVIEDMKIRNLSPPRRYADGVGALQGTLLHCTTFWGLNVSTTVVPRK
jgi:hypothetical protein